VSSPRVSIVIPTRNRRQILEDAIRSVLRQSTSDWELIIVDDASEDGTWEWVSRIDDGRVRTLRITEHQERWTARNLGLQEALGNMVLFLDDDDRLRPRAVEHLTAALQRHPEAVAAVGWSIAFDDTGNSRRNRPNSTWWPTTRMMWRETYAGWIIHADHALIRTRLLRDLGGYAPIRSEDRDLTLKLTRIGPITFVPNMVSEYRMHGEQLKVEGLVEIGDRMLRERAESLPSPDREEARRILAAISEWRKGLSAHAGRRYWEALHSYRNAIRLAPILVTSPILGPQFRWMPLRAATSLLIGRRAADIVRRSWMTGRGRLKRSPGSGLAVRIVPDPVLKPTPGPEDRTEPVSMPDPAHRPFVTAIIVNWNGRAHLEVCLQSLAEQTYPSLEVLVVDNGSTDDSAQVVQNAKMGWLPLGRNIGLAPAMNEGARRASGQYLLFLNNDMRFAPDFVERLVESLEANPSAFATDARQFAWDGSHVVHERTCLTDRWRGNPVDSSMVDQDPTDGVAKCLFASAANILVRRDRFDALGGWDPGYPICYEDVDLSMQAWSRGWPIIYVPSAVCWHRVGASTGTDEGRPLTAIGMAAGQVRLALKFFPWPEVARTLLASLRSTASDLVHGRSRMLRLRLTAWRLTLISLPGALKRRRTIRRISGRSPRQFLEWLEGI
jgi:GT2 family glycosyltransferase